ncbi:tail protein [Stenotrophomonas phage B2]|nr:tail protein [Stenotrophomonas phage B2]
MLLDALTYLFKADNRELDKALQESEGKVDNLTDSMKKTEERAASLEKKMTEGFKRIGTAMLATIAISKLLSNATEYAQRVDDLRTFSDNVGVAIGDVDALGGAVERLGGQASGAQSSLAAFSEHVGNSLADMASGSGKNFTALGIRLKDAQGQAKDTVEVMTELAGAVAKMERPKATATLKSFGITDPKTVEMMLKGRDEMTRLLAVQKESGVVTEAQAEQARKYTEVMARWRQATSSSADSVSQAFLPVLTALFTRLSKAVEWMNKNKTFMTGFFIGLAGVVTVMYLPAIISAAAATWALISPFVAVGAAVVAVAGFFALLYDDVMNFLDGNDSLIGRISKDYPIVGDIVKAFAGSVSAAFKLLTGDFSGAMEAFRENGERVKKIFGDMATFVIEMFDKLLAKILGGPEAAEKMKDGMVSAFQTLDSIIRGIIKALLGIITGAWDSITGFYDSSVSMAKSVGSWVGSALGITSDEEAQQEAPYGSAVPLPLGGSDNGANAALAAMAGNPLNSTTSNAINNSSRSTNETNVRIGEVNVQTQATDAGAMAEGVKSELASQLSNLQTESSSGVNR